MDRFRVAENRADRADRVVANHYPGVGRRSIAELFRRGAVTVNGRRAKKGQFVAAGSEVAVAEPPRDHRARAPEPEIALGLEVVYEDGDLVAVNKPGAMPCHPLRAGESGTLANALVARYPECARASDDAREAGLVHRLDTGTSGVILAARNASTWRTLRTAFGRGQVSKLYWALVARTDMQPRTCTLALVNRGKRMAVSEIVTEEPDARPLDAQTRWRPGLSLAGHTLLLCLAKTGRRHQVRVHLAHFAAPIVGDAQYGGPEPSRPIAGHFLHARAITFSHPATGRSMRIAAPLPGDRQALLDSLRNPPGEPASGAWFIGG